VHELSENQRRALLSSRPPDAVPKPHFTLTRHPEAHQSSRYVVTLYVPALPGGYGHTIRRCRGAATIAQAAMILEELQREQAPRCYYTHRSKNHRPRLRTPRWLPVFFDEKSLLDFIHFRRGRGQWDLERVISRAARKADLRHQFTVHRLHPGRFRGLLKARYRYGDGSPVPSSSWRPHGGAKRARLGDAS